MNEQSGNGQDSDSDGGTRVIEIQLGTYDGDMAATIMAMTQDGQWKERFSEFVAHVGTVLPQLADISREAMYMAYCAGRMHGCEDTVGLMKVREDAATQLTTRAIAAAGRKFGVTEEQLDAAIQQAAEKQAAERKEQTHAQ